MAGKLAVQITKRLGARRVIAVGRNPEALEELKGLGVDAVISLSLDKAALVEGVSQEVGRGGWRGCGAGLFVGCAGRELLEAIAQKGLQHSAARIRFVQVGSSAGGMIAMPAAVLRSSGLEMLGVDLEVLRWSRLCRQWASF